MPKPLKKPDPLLTKMHRVRGEWVTSIRKFVAQPTRSTLQAMGAAYDKLMADDLTTFASCIPCGFEPIGGNCEGCPFFKIGPSNECLGCMSQQRLRSQTKLSEMHMTCISFITEWEVRKKRGRSNG